MDFHQACEWLQNLDFPTDVREGTWLFPTIETVHVLALVTVVGYTLLIDLRLVGLANRHRRVTDLTRQCLPVIWSAFAVAAVAGSLMFSSKAVTYFGNPPFRLKMACLVLAGLNMAWFHLTTYRRVDAWDEGVPPTAARVAGAVSLMLWTVIVGAGRWVGYTT
jgi:hypothetical protein